MSLAFSACYEFFEWWTAVLTGDAVTIAGNATFEWDGEIEIDPATGQTGALTVTRRRDDETAAWAALRG